MLDSMDRTSRNTQRRPAACTAVPPLARQRRTEVTRAAQVGANRLQTTEGEQWAFWHQRKMGVRGLVL